MSANSVDNANPLIGVDIHSSSLVNHNIQTSNHINLLHQFSCVSFSSNMCSNTIKISKTILNVFDDFKSWIIILLYIIFYYYYTSYLQVF